MRWAEHLRPFASSWQPGIWCPVLLYPFCVHFFTLKPIDISSISNAFSSRICICTHLLCHLFLDKIWSSTLSDLELQSNLKASLEVSDCGLDNPPPLIPYKEGKNVICIFQTAELLLSRKVEFSQHSQTCVFWVGLILISNCVSIIGGFHQPQTSVQHSLSL